MTNILSLPQLAGSFAFANNADWRDALQFVAATGGAPVDLTGIAFRCQVRAAGGGNALFLDLSTANGLLINGGTNGTLSFAAPVASTKVMPPGAYIADLIASGDGAVVNLFSATPAAVNVTVGVTPPGS